MNESKIVEQILNNRSSHRKFTDKEISSSVLDKIIDGARSAPTSRHAQSYSIICVRNKEKLKKIAEIAGQPYIAGASVFLLFITDMYRFSRITKEGQESLYNNSITPIMASTLDIGLAMMGAITVGESEGIGSCCIGVVRYSTESNHRLEKIRNLFDLPKHTMPNCGLIMGYKKRENATKASLPKSCHVFMEKYDSTAFDKVKGDYDKQMVEHYNKIGLKDFAEPWTKSMTDNWIYNKDQPTPLSTTDKLFIDFAHKQGLLLRYKV